jgi:hypothetical protein
LRQAHNLCDNSPGVTISVLDIPLQGRLYPRLAIGQELNREKDEVIRCGQENLLHPARQG